MTPEERITRLENIIAALVKSDRYTFEKTVQFLDGRNVQVGQTNGTQIGTSKTQKLGFFGAAPVVPTNIPFPVAASDLYNALASLGLVYHT